MSHSRYLIAFVELCMSPKSQMNPLTSGTTGWVFICIPKKSTELSKTCVKNACMPVFHFLSVCLLIRNVWSDALRCTWRYHWVATLIIWQHFGVKFSVILMENASTEVEGKKNCWTRKLGTHLINDSLITHEFWDKMLIHWERRIPFEIIKFISVPICIWLP